MNYYKNGEIWQEGKMVMSKEEVEADKNTTKRCLQKGAN